MTSEPLFMEVARADVRAQVPSSWSVVQSLLNRIDHLEREAELREDDDSR